MVEVLLFLAGSGLTATLVAAYGLSRLMQNAPSRTLNQVWDALALVTVISAIQMLVSLLAGAALWTG